MTPQYEVIWAGAAEKDLRDLIEYIVLDNHAKASEILAKIKNKAASLYAFPERGRLVPELRDQGISIYRELIVAPWRVIYRIVEHKIYISVVLDARRNIEDTLLKRLI
jgi:toxin ParE1/3/4